MLYAHGLSMQADPPHRHCHSCCSASCCSCLCCWFPAGTKLVCALGPSSHSVDVLEAMLNAGMVGARIDLTWGGLDFHRESLRALNVGAAWLMLPVTGHQQ